MDVTRSLMTDLNHTTYQQYQWHEITPARIVHRAAQVKPANKFNYDNGQWHPQQYEGFAIISMMNDNPQNQALSHQLTAFQNTLKDNLDPEAYYFLPPASFHQTIANTLSAETFRINIVDRGLESQYPEFIAQAFQKMIMPVSVPY